MAIAITGLLGANALSHMEVLELIHIGRTGERLGIAIVVLLISLIGGRIIPSFTRNWLVKRGVDRLPAGFGRLDRFGLVLTLIALSVWVAGNGSPAIGSLLILAGLANVARLARWRGHHTSGEPLVWSLRLGFAWVPIGLCMLGLGSLLPETFPSSVGPHALPTGAIGSMMLAVMTRHPGPYRPCANG